MIKVLHVAVREFLATVATKGFLFSLVILPIILLVVLFGFRFLLDDEAPRVEGEVAIVDPTGFVVGEIKEHLKPESIARRRDDFAERVAAASNTLWVHFPEGVARSRLTPAVLARRAGSTVTALTGTP